MNFKNQRVCCRICKQILESSISTHFNSILNAVQQERGFQKQPTVFLNKKKAVGAKKVNIKRYTRTVGLGFKTPAEVRCGVQISTTQQKTICPKLTMDTSQIVNLVCFVFPHLPVFTRSCCILCPPNLIFCFAILILLFSPFPSFI